MLKVRTRRAHVHGGGGIPAKASVKAKGYKKDFLSSCAQQDATLITSTPRRPQKAGARSVVASTRSCTSS